LPVFPECGFNRGRRNARCVATLFCGCQVEKFDFFHFNDWVVLRGGKEANAAIQSARKQRHISEKDGLPLKLMVAFMQPF